MDQKSWPWKKKSNDTLRADKVNNSFTRNEEVNEFQELLDEKAELERSLRISNEKLSAALADCNAKDIITKKQVKIAQEAIAGWEKADGEAISLKKELDKVLLQKAASEERSGHLDAALKECMHQLRFVRDDQEKRVHGAMLKTSEGFEKTCNALAEKLAEAGKKLSKLEAENTQLRKALSGKDKVIEELSKYRAEVESDFNTLMLRVESTEKQNTSLKYEVRVLEKELDIRNEEREFIHRTADVASKQQQESVKKIGKLESECQRLRLLVRKRLPGPAALTKMKNEVAMLGNDYFPTRRKSNPSLINSMDFRVDPSHDARIDFLIDQLHKMEGENRSLKNALNTKSSDFQFSRLSRIEGQVEDSPKVHPITEPGKNSVAALSDTGSDDKASCAESWAISLISELTPYQNTGASELSLMDDFAEMEKLAVVSVDYPAGSSHHSSEEGNRAIGTPAIASHVQSELLISSQEFRDKDNVAFGDMLKILVDYCQASEKNPVEVLEDIKVALAQNKLLNLNASDIGNGYNILSTKNLESDVSVSVHKILELLKGINITCEDNSAEKSFSRKDDKILSYKNSETPTGYIVRVFQWKSAEVYNILQRFVQTCNDLLSGKADLEQFAQEVASNLDWIMNHCFSIQDVSCMKDAIRNHLDWDESRSESEVDSGSVNHSVESNRVLSPLSGCNSSRMEPLQPNMKDKEFSVADPEDRSQPENINMVENSQPEMEITKHCEVKTGDKNEKENLLKEDLEIQPTETNLQQRKVHEKISQLENELEKKSEYCERLEETCNDLKIQLESLTSKEASDHGKHWGEQLRNEWEITAASEKLAECQETILNLGKQLKELSTTKDAALFDKVISTPAHTVTSAMSTPHRISRRSSLLDKMLAEDSDRIGSSSSRTKDDIPNRNSFSSISTNAAMEPWSKFTNPDEDEIKPPAASMALGPYKKNGGRSLFKKLFLRAKKGNSKKTPSQ